MSDVYFYFSFFFRIFIIIKFLFFIKNFIIIYSKMVNIYILKFIFLSFYNNNKYFKNK